MKTQNEYYWYEDVVSWKVIFGIRGGQEFKDGYVGI